MPGLFDAEQNDRINILISKTIKHMDISCWIQDNTHVFEYYRSIYIPIYSKKSYGSVQNNSIIPA